MQPLKIIITLLVLVLGGIVVGSNLSVLMAVVVLNQPTGALPIGIWLIIAVGLGILSSTSIQLLIFLQQRSLTKKIRQLQTRLQQQDEDIFTYTSSAPDSTPEAKTDSPPPRSRFSFGRNRQKSTPSQSSSNFNSPSPAKPIGVNDDDWEEEPIFNSQLDWDEVPPPRQQTSRTTTETPLYSSPNSPNRDRVEFRSASNPDPELTRTDGIYDADFRLIQPPYKQPLEEEDLEYLEEDDDREEYDAEDGEEYDDPIDDIGQIFSKQSNRPSDLAEEDWGFNFDDRDAEVKTSRPRNRKN
jgi:hypothetical protein